MQLGEDHLKKFPRLKKEINTNIDKETNFRNQKKMKEYLTNIQIIRDIHRKEIEKMIEGDEKEIKKLALEKLEDKYIEEIIIKEGDKNINYWWRFKYLIIIGSLVFLVGLYFIFWYIANNFPMVEESFTTLFCVI